MYYWGTVFCLLLASSSWGQSEIKLFNVFTDFEQQIQEMEGDTTFENFSWKISKNQKNIIFEKGGSLFPGTVAWYKVSFEDYTAMWSSQIGRLWTPYGNATFLPTKNGLWMMSISTISNPKKLKKTLKRVRKLRAEQD